MDTLAFVITPAAEHEHSVWHIELLVNGRSFAAQVGEVERPYAEAEGHPDLAGCYGFPRCNAYGYSQLADAYLGWIIDDSGLADDEEEDAEIIDLPLARPPAAGESVRVDILECGKCGHSGCWPLTAEILVEPDHIIWRRFSQVHRSGLCLNCGCLPRWDYSALGTFTFARQPYEAEVQKLRDIAAQLAEQEAAYLASPEYAEFLAELAREELAYLFTLPVAGR